MFKRTLTTKLSGDWPQCQLQNHTVSAQTFTSLTHTHSNAHKYLQFLYEHFLGGVYIQRGADTGSTGLETASILLSDGLFFLRLLLSHLSPSMSFYLHSRLFSSNSLPDRGRGAALLLRVEHRGLCRAEYTQKGMVRQG